MSDGRIHLELEPRIDDYNKKFYIAKLKGPFLLDCSEKAGGIAFMVFVSDEGNEELQISQITGPKRERDDRK
jgi:hypothetical protein